MSNLSCVVVDSDAPATSAVIWMHGLGASGHDFEDLVPLLRLPHVRFIFPNAPERPVTINGGMMMPSWYDLRSLGPSADREDHGEVSQSADLIKDVMQQELDRGIPAKRMVLAGFSQGGAMAMHVGLRYPETLAGIMSLSAYLVAADAVKSEMNEANLNTPILLCHGTHDPMVPMAGGEHARDTLKELNPSRDIQWRAFPMQHEVCVDEIGVIADWLHERLPGRGF